MALMNCPECGKEVSDQAYSCPHCGYVVASSSSPVQSGTPIKPTLVGPQNRQVFLGSTGTVVGMLMIGAGILLAFVLLPLGIVIAAVGAVLLTKANAAAVGTHDIVCPYCKTPGTIETPAQSYRCPACSKKSVKRDGYMHPVL